MSLLKKVQIAFQEAFSEAPAFLLRAPGRVNLIGEHTDYNDGFVLPMAIDRVITIALRPRRDQRVHLRSLDFAEPAEFSLNEITHGSGWGDYIRGVAWVLEQEGFELSGWEGILASDIPVGAGLSSSAALELAAARAFQLVSHWEWDARRMALACQNVENEWLGLQSGIMDQMASASGKEGHAILLDCRDLSIDRVPLPKGVTVIILDTATRRGLVGSAYNERVTQCNQASDFFGVPALRDVSLNTFAKKEKELAPLIRQRARHIITENERTLQAAEAMRNNDAEKLGALMNESHRSLCDDFEVSSEALNAMVEIAQAQPGCLGARMTGAGFGGCAVALVRDEQVAAFVEKVYAVYRHETELTPNIYPCQPSNGVEKVFP